MTRKPLRKLIMDKMPESIPVEQRKDLATEMIMGLGSSNIAASRIHLYGQEGENKICYEEQDEPVLIGEIEKLCQEDVNIPEIFEEVREANFPQEESDETILTIPQACAYLKKKYDIGITHPKELVANVGATMSKESLDYSKRVGMFDLVPEITTLKESRKYKMTITRERKYPRTISGVPKFQVERREIYQEQIRKNPLKEE